jgi:hypothetical protein
MERTTEPPVTMIRPTKNSLMPNNIPMAHTPDRGNCRRMMMPSQIDTIPRRASSHRFRYLFARLPVG